MLYGYKFLPKEESEYNIVSYENFIDFYYNTLYETDLLFDKFSNGIIISEDTPLMIEDKSANSSKFNFKQFVNTIWEKIKELFNKFIGFVGQCIKNIADKISEFYNSGGLVDRLNKEMLPELKWQDLEVAKSKGWKGIDKKYSLVTPCTILNEPGKIKRKLDDVLERMKAKDKLDKLYDICYNYREIRMDEDGTFTTTANSAKSIYDDIVEDIDKYKEKIDTSSLESLLFQESLNFGYLFNSEKSPLFYTYGKDQDYYYPLAKDFAVLKDMVSQGMKQIRLYKQNADVYIKEHKKDFIDPVKNQINSIKNADDKDTVSYQKDVSIYYSKAQLKLNMFVLKAATNCFKNSVTILKKQHSTAVQTYTYIAYSTYKYLAA